MPWYYAKDGQRLGPYSEREFRGLIGQGSIADDTLVWRDGMADWRPYREVALPVADVAPAADPYGMVEPASVSGGTGQSMVVCSSCGGMFNQDEVISYQGAFVCAACKPVFVQQIKEGVRVSSSMDYAGFWVRFAAKFIDGIILGVVNGIFSAILGGVANAGQDSPVAGLFIVLIYVISLSLNIGYTTYFLGKFGATPGKMALQLRVVTAEGDPISYMRAFGRFWAEIISGLICYIGYIMVAFDGEKRALHDHICSTRVVRA